MLLEALVACAGVTLGAVATALDIEVENGKVHAEGDLDFRGTLGVDKEAPVGFEEIRLSFELETDADDEQLATLLKLTERYCVVYQTLARGPRLQRRDGPCSRGRVSGLVEDEVVRRPWRVSNGAQAPVERDRDRARAAVACTAGTG